VVNVPSYAAVTTVVVTMKITSKKHIVGDNSDEAAMLFKVDRIFDRRRYDPIWKYTGTSNMQKARNCYDTNI
jgi:hypothetical protein